MEISNRTVAPGAGVPAAMTGTAETAEAAPALADAAQADPSAAPAGSASNLRELFDMLFGPARALPEAGGDLLVLLKDGPGRAPKQAAAPAHPTDQQRAAEALKTGQTPPAAHPRMQHVNDVRERLQKQGLPTDAAGVRVYVVGDSPGHGDMVVRTIAGPAGLAPRADVSLSEKLPDPYTSRLPDDGVRMEHVDANLSVKLGQADSAQLKMWAVDALEAAYTQPKAELDYLVAHAPKDGQTKIVNMSWGNSEEALVALATKAALGNADSPLTKELNKRRAAAGLPPLDLSRPQAKEDLRQFIAGLIHQAVTSPDGAKRIQTARADATVAVAKAREAGFLPIAAAGNFFEGTRTNERSRANENLVATIPGVLSVGSVALGDPTKNGDETMGKSSSTGAAVSAPGVDVPVGYDTKTRRSTDVSGTSFAAPYAASVAALMVKANPNITPAQIEKILLSATVATDVKGTSRDGAGVIDPVAAVRAAKDLMRAGEVGFHTSQDLDPAVRRAALDALKQMLPTTSAAYKAAVDLINNDHFVELDATTQKNLLAGLAAHKTDAALVKDVAQLVASRQFNELGPAARARFAQTFVGLEAAERGAAMQLLTRPDIAQLPAPIKDAVTAAAAKAPADTTTIDALVKRANDPVFGKLPADAQAAFLRAFEHQHDTFEINDAGRKMASLLALVDSPAFRKLDATAQSRWMEALASPDSTVRDRSYERLESALGRTAGQGDDARVLELGKRASALDAGESVRTDRATLPDAAKTEPEISGPREDSRSVFFRADGKKGIDPRKVPVIVYTVTIEGRAIEVIYPKDSKEPLPRVLLIAQGLAGLPANERVYVQQVIVDPRFKSTMQAANAREGRPNRIFMGGEGPDNPREMTGILSHEAGHLVGAERFKADPALLAKWQAAMKADNHSVSDYATTTLQEDVAETITLYYQVKGTPEEAAMKREFPNRYAAVRELLKDQ